MAPSLNKVLQATKGCREKETESSLGMNHLIGYLTSSDSSIAYIHIYAHMHICNINGLSMLYLYIYAFLYLYV